MFEEIPSDLMKAVTQEPLTGNFHHYGITVQVPEKYLQRAALPRTLVYLQVSNVST